MATRFQITCITKPDRNNPHTAIQYIGGVSGGQRWRISEAQAITDIENNKYLFFVNRGGREVDVIIGTRNGRKYLKTREDDDTHDNLLSLPECP